MLIENFDHKLDLIYENQDLIEKRLEKKIDVFRGEVNKRFNQIDERFDLSFKHFSNIEDDLADIKSELKKMDKNKIDKKKLRILEVRVERLERRLEKQMEKTKRN